MRERVGQGQSIIIDNGEAGITLVEVMVACALTVILFTAAFSTLTSSMKSVNIQSDKLDAQEIAQTAISRMEREIRQAQKPFLVVVGSPGINETLEFKADLNDDGTAEAIEYQYNGYNKTLIRLVNTTGTFDFASSPRDTIAPYVANTTTQPIFSYFGTDLNTPLDPTSPSSDINNQARLIKVRLVIDKNGNKPPSAVDMATDVKLRNFAY